MASYVLAVVHLYHTQTGQRIIYHDSMAYPTPDAAYEQWIEGECSCDCNRGLAIWKATNKGRAMPDAMQLPCRRGLRAVIKIEEIELIAVTEGASIAHATAG